MPVFRSSIDNSSYIIFVFWAVINLSVLYYKSYKFFLLCQDHADYSPFAFFCAFLESVVKFSLKILRFVWNNIEPIGQF